MAIRTNLRCVFGTASGRNLSVLFNWADANASAAQIKTLMQIMVANKDVYSEPPLELVGAEIIQREVREINIA